MYMKLRNVNVKRNKNDAKFDTEEWNATLVWNSPTWLPVSCGRLNGALPVVLQRVIRVWS